MSDPDIGELSQAQYYDRIREQIQHEDELVNLRVVWQLLAQSFFFSTYASLLTVKAEAKSLLYELNKMCCYGWSQSPRCWLVF